MPRSTPIAFFVAGAVCAAITLVACSDRGDRAGPAAQDARSVWTGALDEAAFAALHDLKAESAPPRLGGRVTVAPPGNRTPFTAYLSRPLGAEAPVPAVVLVHEWWGLNEHIEHWADRIAAMGYAAIAVDLYDGVVATTREEAMAAMRSIDPDRALGALRAAVWYARSHPAIEAPRVASLGWCLGGKWSLELALAEPALDAAVVYYGQVTDDVERLRAIRGELLGVFGTRDASIPNDQVDAFEAALAAAGVPHRILRYDAEHAFANPSGARYDAANAEAAWAETRAFLSRVLAGR
jgi:carboxymethylenebutenolidase